MASAASAVKAPREQFAYTVRMQCTEAQYEIVNGLAAALKVSAAAALRYLVELHAGKVMEERQEMEQAPAPFTVLKFGKPRMSRELASYVAGLVAAGLPRDTALDM